MGSAPPVEEQHRFSSVAAIVTERLCNLVTRHGLFAFDFADLRVVLANRGRAAAGIGVAQGDARAQTAAQYAIDSPLLGRTVLAHAQWVIINLNAGRDILMREIEEVLTTVRNALHHDTLFCIGLDRFPETDQANIEVLVVAAGVSSEREEPRAERQSCGKTFLQPATIPATDRTPFVYEVWGSNVLGMGMSVS